MKLFFIPGRIPSLSLLELTAVLTAHTLSYSLDVVTPTFIVLTVPDDFQIQNVFFSLGGMIKYGIRSAQAPSLDAALKAVEQSVMRDATTHQGRITFGISTYTIAQSGRKENRRALAYSLQKAGIAIKKELRAHGISARFVAPQKNEQSLSSVTVAKNHLCEEKNNEYVLMFDGEGWPIGTTRAVQAFEEFSERDWNRPHRDMSVGLLPPKIARMMINLAAVPTNALIIDPFCGLGTILQEALLLGYTALFGSDIEKNQIEATRKNLAWLAQKNNTSLDSVTLTTCDAKNLSKNIVKKHPRAIVTEPYLGPIMRRSASGVNSTTLTHLCALYVDAFHDWKKILAPGERVVVVFPFWITRTGKTFLSCVNDILNLGYTNSTVPAALKKYIRDTTPRDSLLIAREGQHVGRELFVFTRV